MQNLLVRVFLQLASISLILATSNAEATPADTIANDSPPCHIGGKQWSQGYQYIVGGPNLYPSVYAQCNNGVATCFNQTAIQDLDPEVMSCNHPALWQEGLYLPQPAKRWPRGVACFRFDSSFNAQQRRLFQDGMNEYAQRTGFRFLALDECSANSGLCNYCRDSFQIIQRENACWAHQGYRPGANMQLNFGASCYYDGALLHELGHVVGLAHEHQHPNREVVVLKNEIRVAPVWYAKDFSLGRTAYDRKSVMHYARWAGLCVPRDPTPNYCDSINPEPGCVEPTSAHCDPSQDRTFGVSKNLSDGDVALVQAMYNGI